MKISQNVHTKITIDTNAKTAIKAEALEPQNRNHCHIGLCEGDDENKTETCKQHQSVCG